jgi:hypothetical protein
MSLDEARRNRLRDRRKIVINLPINGLINCDIANHCRNVGFLYISSAFTIPISASHYFLSRLKIDSYKSKAIKLRQVVWCMQLTYSNAITPSVLNAYRESYPKKETQ